VDERSGELPSKEDEVTKTIVPPEGQLDRDIRRLTREVTAHHRDQSISKQVAAAGSTLAVIGIEELKPHPKNHDGSFGDAFWIHQLPDGGVIASGVGLHLRDDSLVNV